MNMKAKKQATKMVRITGVEPAWSQTPQGPEPCASANSAISASNWQG